MYKRQTYYTYALRTIFVTDVTRNLDELSVLQLLIDTGVSGTGELLTEDGIDGTDLPLTSNLENEFYNFTYWEHHWSEFMHGTKGAGVMFTDSSNFKLYTFDNATIKTGALVVEKQQLDDSDGYIKVNPIEQSLSSVTFGTSKDVTWHGAVVTFNGEPIYRSSDDGGLWVMVEHPPIVTVN